MNKKELEKLAIDARRTYYRNWRNANKDKVMDQNLGYGGSTTCDFSPPGYPDE